MVHQLSSSWLGRLEGRGLVLAAFLRITTVDTSGALMALVGHVKYMQSEIGASFAKKGSLTSHLQAALNRYHNSASSVIACQRFNQLLIASPVIAIAASSYSDISASWMAMEASTIAMHHAMFMVLLRLHVFKSRSRPLLLRAAAASPATFDLTPMDAEGAAEPLETPANPILRETSLIRVAGWACRAMAGNGQHDSALRQLGQCSLNPNDSMPRPEQEAFAAFLPEGSGHVGAADLLVPHRPMVAFFATVQTELRRAPMAAASLVSLRGSAFISWERTLEGSLSLWEAFKLAVGSIERPSDLVDALDDPKLRVAEGFLVRRYINGMHRQVLGLCGAEKSKGSESSDLALRTGLKGLDSSKKPKVKPVAPPLALTAAALGIPPSPLLPPAAVAPAPSPGTLTPPQDPPGRPALGAAARGTQMCSYPECQKKATNCGMCLGHCRMSQRAPEGRVCSQGHVAR